MAERQSTLSILISSKQLEFAAERADLREILRPLPLLVANAAETWAPESTPVLLKSIDEAANCAIYLGLFGCVYSEPTILEYRAASRNPHREILVYIKQCRQQRDRELEEFLETVKDGRTVVQFTDWVQVRDRIADHLWRAVQRMIERLLRLGNPPTALGSSGAMARKWTAEKSSLLELGLPAEPQDAAHLAAWLQDALATSGRSR
jgi:hypothetical protein